MVMKGDLTLGDEHTIQYTNDVLENCTLETCISLLINVTPINSMKIKTIHVFLQNVISSVYNAIHLWEECLGSVESQENYES